MDKQRQWGDMGQSSGHGFIESNGSGRRIGFPVLRGNRYVCSLYSTVDRFLGPMQTFRAF